MTRYGNPVNAENDRPTTWPIATCMHGTPARTADGTPFHDAPDGVWADAFAEIADAGFTLVELPDSHVRLAELAPARRETLLAIAREQGVAIPSVHIQRKSVIMPDDGEANLAYAHASIDAAAEAGVTTFSTGLHRPFTQRQADALWFWTVDGVADAEDDGTFQLAAARLRELGRHAASVGMQLSLELYEDTLLGAADSAVRLVETIGLDNVGLNPDVGNLIRLHRPIEDWQDVYEKTLPYANYWHMKNYSRDEDPDGAWVTAVPSTLEAGLINYRAVVRRALELGFRGPFVMEQYGGDSLGVCATNRRYLEGLLTSVSAR